ncbi:MAG: hypothetical protein ACUVV3_01965 [Dehalococcoidia bacterium]
MERLGISAALSIALVPLGLFLLNLLVDIPVDVSTTLILTLTLALIGTLAALWRRPTRRLPLAAAEQGNRSLSRRLTGAVRGGDAARTLALGIIMGFAFYTSMIPRLDYSYPLHEDEWTHFAEARTIATEGAIPFFDPVTGEDRSDPVTEETRSSPHFEVGYHLFLAEFQLLTGLPWLAIFRYLPSSVFALTVFSAFIFGNRRGFGLEAALFASLVPTTVRFLGPAFAVPVALGLFFIPLVLFLVSNFWASKGLPVLLMLLLSFLFIAHAPTALFACLIIAVYGIFQTLRPALCRRTITARALAHLGTVLVAILLSSLPLLAYNNWLVGEAAAESLPQYLLVAPGGLIPRLGYIPYPLFVLGLTLLAIGGRRTDRALLVTTVLVAAYAFLHYQLGVGNAALYSRSILYLSLLVLLVAGLATARVRRWLATGLRRRWAGAASWAGVALVVLVVMLPSVGLALQSRYEERYYHRIGDTQYEDFVWVRDHLCRGYERALTDPKFGRPFAAITGRYAYAAIPTTAAPVRPAEVDEARLVLREGVPDADWLRERDLSIVYSTKRVENAGLVQVHDRVYVLPEAEVCQPEGLSIVAKGSRAAGASLDPPR